MSIDIRSETLLTFPEAAKLRPGRRHLSTLHRWRLRGVRGIKLETALIGGRRYTSEEALDRFHARTTTAADGLPVTVQDTPTAARRRQLDRVNAELAAREL